MAPVSRRAYGRLFGYPPKCDRDQIPTRRGARKRNAPRVSVSGTFPGPRFTITGADSGKRHPGQVRPLPFLTVSVIVYRIAELNELLDFTLPKILGKRDIKTLCG